MTRAVATAALRALGLSALSLCLSAAPSLAQDESECPQEQGAPSGPAQALPNLSGIWEGPDGEVEIDTLSQGRTVLAYFRAGSGECPFGDSRGVFLDGKFDGHRIAGRMTRCTRVEVLIDKCGKTPVYETDFYTRSVTKDSIVGCWKTEHYRSKEGSDGGQGDDTGADECPYERDSGGDRYLQFVLTRKEISPCPDMTEIEKINDAAENAASFLRVVARMVSDPKIQGILDSSQSALDKISAALGIAVKAGEKCNEIHDALGELRRFKDAIDEVNSASCGQRLAAAFDHLFTSAGKLGQRFVNIPTLGPVFDLLAYNESFFQDVSADLNPEQRWAGQFAGVEGYTATCPGD
ncbi:MAG: hypothetical protein ACOY3L_10670 [Pseudomonadota bacterium]